MCFTFMWDLDSEADTDFVRNACQKFESHGARIALVELTASLEQRLLRNRGEERLREKPSKRDVDKSEASLLHFERELRLNSNGELPVPYPHILIDNTALTPAQAAAEIVDRLALVRIR